MTHPRRTVFPALAVATSVLFVWGSAHSQSQQTSGYRAITFQARITQDGVPFSGTADLHFEIYATNTGGTPLWSETQSGVTIVNGILAVRFGEDPSNPLGDVFSPDGGQADRWVAVKADSLGPEIMPRVPLTAVPWAFSAQRLGEFDLAALDARYLSATPTVSGEILVGTDTGYQRLAPGSQGQVLTIGSDGRPRWETPTSVDPPEIQAYAFHYDGTFPRSFPLQTLRPVSAQLYGQVNLGAGFGLTSAIANFNSAGTGPAGGGAGGRVSGAFFQRDLFSSTVFSGIDEVAFLSGETTRLNASATSVSGGLNWTLTLTTSNSNNTARFRGWVNVLGYPTQ